jgi:deazaflavin-dependent oxidoreductase (nitroreductase family)
VSDATSAANRETMREWLANHRARYLGSGGRDGHVEDMRDRGALAFTPHCMIRYKGRTSGKTYISPLIYGAIGGEVVIVASKGGADRHPQWYLNIKDNREIDFQIATQAFRGTWREPEGEERAEVWNFMVKNFPPYAEYQKSTTRQIPLVMMTPVEAIPVFDMNDAEEGPYASQSGRGGANGR